MELLKHKTEVGESGRVFKFFFQTEDKNIVEAVLVDRDSKSIVCYGTQIGCPMKCNLCDAGEYVRDLTVCELNTMATTVANKARANKPLLFSAMGVGEPTLNSDYNRHLKFLMAKNVRLAFSTIVPRPDKFDHLLDVVFCYPFVKVQLSLHAINKTQRAMIFGAFPVPLDNINQAISLLKAYNFKSNQYELNYTLIDGVNDSVADAKHLAQLFAGHKIKINQFNPVKSSTFQPSTNVKNFLDVLHVHGVNFEQYATNGADIRAACGMMTNARVIPGPDPKKRP